MPTTVFTFPTPPATSISVNAKPALLMSPFAISSRILTTPQRPTRGSALPGVPVLSPMRLSGTSWEHPSVLSLVSSFRVLIFQSNATFELPDISMECDDLRTNCLAKKGYNGHCYFYEKNCEYRPEIARRGKSGKVEPELVFVRFNGCHSEVECPEKC